MQSSIALLCLVVLVCVHSTVTDTLDTQDTHLSRHRRVRSVGDIVDGLTTNFNKYLSSVFDVDEDDFKDILKALGKLKLAVLKALLNKFFDLKDKHHDFGSAENFQRVSQMMESLEADIQQQEVTSGVTQDTQLPRPVDDIVDGLTTKFSKYLSSVFDVDEDDFKDILKALGKLKLAVLKALLNKFFDLKDKHHDFGSAENFQRVSQMMESLEADIQQKEASSGAPTPYVTMTSLTIPLLPVIAKVLN
ncbi:uncharacterized protein [Haliotis cracherodii]|uniref:uncharacterized protein n=1 Tax=Haliotis cracherodii TaxID=6455 RepID=UPI0039EAE775